MGIEDVVKLRQLLTGSRRLGPVLLLLFSASLAAQAGKDQPERLYDLTVQNTTALAATIQFAAENAIPAGIIVGPEQKLCAKLRTLDFKQRSLDHIMNDILSNSDYMWRMETGVLMVRPRQMTGGANYLLHLKFPRFSAPRTTIQGIGIILAGYIHASLRPGEGFAGSIPSSSDAKKGTLDLTDVTVEQIANRAVLLPGKGLWILYPVPDDPRKMGDARRLYIYGYDDWRVLPTLSCSNPNDSAANWIVPPASATSCLDNPETRRKHAQKEHSSGSI
jgi:hypothetical protein